MTRLKPSGRALLIGSLPLDNHLSAIKWVQTYTPDIPLWVQLPVNANEGMMVQFLPGLPGITMGDDHAYVNTDNDTYEDDILTFYEDFMAVTEGEKDLDDSRFVLTNDTAEGFFVFKDNINASSSPPFAVKGQITGPITFTTGTKDQNGRAIFYDDQLRDVGVKLLAQKAKWQMQQLKAFRLPVMIFFDEPALAGFGSSAFIGMSKDDILNCFAEVIQAVHVEDGLAGVHVCANTEWSLILESKADIVSFDAYSYFDKFKLYAAQVKKFIKRGGIMAWGIVPTSDVDDIENETADKLALRWKNQFQELVKLGIDESTLFSQSLITPSCGTGSISVSHAERVLELTRDVSRIVRDSFAR